MSNEFFFRCYGPGVTTAGFLLSAATESIPAGLVIGGAIVALLQLTWPKIGPYFGRRDPHAEWAAKVDRLADQVAHLSDHLETFSMLVVSKVNEHSDELARLTPPASISEE